MNFNVEKFNEWELEKAVFILATAQNLGMNLSAYGECAVNPNSGYTYLWLEDYDFALYMPINCEIHKDDIYVLWSNPDNGTEIEQSLTNFTDLKDIENWCESLRTATE
jgi:hypothetical protein